MLIHQDLLNWQSILDLANELQNFQNFLPNLGKAALIDRLITRASLKLAGQVATEEVFSYGMESNPSPEFAAVAKMIREPIGMSTHENSYFYSRKSHYTSDFLGNESELESLPSTVESQNVGNAARVKDGNEE